MAKFDKYNHEETWPYLKQVLLGQGIDACIDRIKETQDPFERNSWFRFLIRCLAFRDWPDKNLDDLIKVGDETIASAKAAIDLNPEDADWWRDQVRINSYNMAANLADCWKDGLFREQRHFEKGLFYARLSLRIAEDMGKPPAQLASAYWSIGKHLMSMKRYRDAHQAFTAGLEHEQRSATANGKSTSVVSHAPFGLLLATGFTALADLRLQRSSGKKTLQQVYRAFEEMMSLGDQQKEDGEFGILQLRESERLN